MTRKSLGPRVRDGSKTEARARDEEEALRQLSKEITALESQKQTVSRLMLQLLSGYENVMRKVKASGDRTLATETATNLRNLASVYKALQSMRLLEHSEEDVLDQYLAGLHEAASNIEMAQRKVETILRKVSKQQQVLGEAQRRVVGMKRLQVEEASFFDSPDRREVARRKREIERRRRQ